MTAREAETRRRRRERAEAREQAYREWVVGAPLIDASRPVIGGGNDVEHLRLLVAEVQRRQVVLDYEARKLAAAFPAGCWVVQAEADRMWPELADLLDSLPGPEVGITHSTSPMTVRAGPITQEIPALAGREPEEPTP